MSFSTSFFFYRPEAPPGVTPADVAAFVRAFAGLGVVEGGRSGYEIKFGRSIDQDDRPTTWDEPVEPGGWISVVREIEYDAEATDFPSPTSLADDLAKLDPRPIYRANIFLGQVAPTIWDRLCREPSEENEIPLGLDGWILQIGPIVSTDLAAEESYQVGWIALGMDGRGYLYPWTFRDLIDRAEAIPEIRAVEDLCRRTWPCTGGKPGRRVVSQRRALGNLWPYPADRPWDWSWGLNEQG